MNSKYEWTPTVGVGPILLGTPVQKYVDAGILKPYPVRKELGGGFFYINDADDITAFPDEDDITGLPDESAGLLIESIKCGKSILYRGEELLGKPIDEIAQILGSQPDRFDEQEYLTRFDDDDEDDVANQVIAEFDDVDLMIWLKDGIAVVAMVGLADYDED